MKKNRKNIRLKDFDYSSNGAYFFTICTKNKEHFFGEIHNGTMCINELGNTIQKSWEDIPHYFSHVQLEAFIVMPNHIHGVISIHKEQNNEVVGARFIAPTKDKDTINRVPTSRGSTEINNNPMTHKESLSKIIRHIKGKATFLIRKTNPSFSWQSRFHDRIIRNEKELEHFYEYTKYNPQNWEKDEENISPQSNIFLALGSNVGDRKKMIENAAEEIKKIATIKKYSHIWESEAWGETDQDAFLNAVIEIETEKNPHDFLKEIQEIEKKLGRKKRYKWGPREIDIDILFWGNKKINTETLTIPHPFWNKRDFVLFPLADIAPEFLPPNKQKKIKKRRDESTESTIAVYGDFFESMK